MQYISKDKKNYEGPLVCFAFEQEAKADLHLDFVEAPDQEMKRSQFWLRRGRA
jgi:hypothetical protein